jgi:Bacteriophage lambda head decoration protein D
MATEQNEKRYIGDVVLAEALEQFAYCRTAVTLAATQTIVIGDLLKNNVDGTWSKWALEATDGTVDGIALEYSTASVPASILAIVRGPAIVSDKYINVNTAAVAADLLGLGILVRTNASDIEMEG